jgi:hypothetical protein
MRISRGTSLPYGEAQSSPAGFFPEGDRCLVARGTSQTRRQIADFALYRVGTDAGLEVPYPERAASRTPRISSPHRSRRI